MLAAGMLAGSFAPQRALAGFTVCGGDPVVQLSNGMSVRLGVIVSDAMPADVAGVHYRVYGPVGTRVENVIYQGALADKESVSYVANETDGQTYQADTKVAMVTGQVRTSVYMVVYETASPWHGIVGSVTSGTSGTDLLSTEVFSAWSSWNN